METGAMEWWSDGVMGLITQHSSTPILQHSIYLNFLRSHLGNRHFWIPVEVRALTGLRYENVQ
jgi:hypothetical protein